MKENLLQMVQRLNRSKKKRARWKKGMAVLACAVVFCTTYALILPAITMEKDKRPVCTKEQLSQHIHTQECKNEKNEIICGYADYAIHTHDARCRDEEENLVCEKTQLLRDEHTDECPGTRSDLKENGSRDTEEQSGSVQKTEESQTEDRTQKEDGASNEEGTLSEKEGETAKGRDTDGETQKEQAATDTKQDEMSEDIVEKEKNHRMTFEGSDYTVKVMYSDEAGLPENVKLEVKELKQESDEYKEYYEQAEAALPEEQGILFCRFFDVSFVSDGKEIEPSAPVDVEISYKKEDAVPVKEGITSTAIHFAEKGVEVIPADIEQNAKGEDTFTFTQDSFSVVGTAVSTISINNGSYVFYKEGYAMGVVNGTLTAIEVTVNENGSVYPKNNRYSIHDITWTYSGGGWCNSSSGKYLFLQDKTATVENNPQTLNVRIINNAIRISTKVKASANVNLYLGFDKNTHRYKVGGLFADGDYFLGAKIATVSDEIVTPGTLSIDDQIKEEGILKAKLNTAVFEGRGLTYTWYRRDNSSGSWKEVIRRRITGEFYNVAEDGSWLNAALDGGADREYMVKVASVDGAQLGYNIESVEYHVPYYAQIQNGDFEEPKIPTEADDDEHYQPLLPNGTAGMVWKTTASDQKVEYVSVASTNFKNMSYKWHNCSEAAKGKQYVELNATESGALYQDVLTVPGSTMYWSLAHRGRGLDTRKNDASMVDTMYVVVMSTKMAETYGITSQDKVNDVINRPYAYPGAKVEKITDDNRRWYYHNGEYDVPDSQYLTRYFFVAGATAFDTYSPGSSIQYTVGNHLDDIYFSTELPPPAAGKVNLEVSKIIRGLDEEHARDLLSRMQFNIDGKVVSGNEFKNFTNNGDGAYTASYQIQLSIGDAASVTKSAEELMTTTKVEGYKLKSVAVSVNGGEAKAENQASVTIKDQETGRIEFENTYEQETETMKIVKVDEKNQPVTGVKFSLEETTLDGWKTIKSSMQVDNNGRITLSDMKRDTLYRLTELETPDGYQILTDRIYFKIIKEDGEARLIPCNENGEQVTGWPVHVKVLDYDRKELKVINEKGAVLPETGGMGTRWLYLGGILLLLTSVVLYGYSKKKKQEGRGDK